MKGALAFAVFLVCSLQAFGSVPDGLWNGKPWDVDEREAAAAKGDPEALAETAFCAWEAYGGVRSSEKTLYENAKKSAEQGNAYGLALLADCYSAGRGVEVDLQKALIYAEAAVKAGHPRGIKSLANVRHALSQDTPEDNRVWREANQQAADAGCISAISNVMRIHLFGTMGAKIDMDYAHTFLIEDFRKGNTVSRETAGIIVAFSKKRVELFKITDEEMARAMARLEMAVDLGDLRSLAVLGRKLCIEGDGERGFPMIVEAADSGDAYAKSAILDRLNSYDFPKENGLSAPFSTFYRLGRESFEGGIVSHRALRWAGLSYGYSVLGGEANPEKALEVIKVFRKINRYSPDYHEILGLLYYNQFNEEITNRERGLAHYVLGSRQKRLIKQLCLATYHRKEKGANFVLSYAAAIAWKKGEKAPAMANTIIKKLREQLTPEQLEEAEDLIARNYPLAEEFQKEALEVLIRYGDLPKDMTLEKLYKDHRW